MPREKDFDQTEVVNRCIRLFAKNGFSATGIQEIVDNTGINRSSLYATFNGKDDLFLTCLNKAAKDEMTMLEGMQKKSTGPKLIDAYLATVIKDQPVSHLFKFANAEFKLLNRKTQSFINAHHRWKLNFLSAAIVEGQKTGKISRKTDAKHLVAMIELINQGVQNLSACADADKLYKKSALEFSSLLKKKNK